MYILQNIPRPEGNPGIGIQTRDQLTLIDVDDIAYMPARNPNNVLIEEDIILKKNRNATTIYMTPGTVEVTSAAEGETDQIGFNVSVKFNHPGNEQPVREFKANCLNRKYIIIVRYCSGKPSDIIGSICNPCKMTPSYTGNKDGNTNEITFDQISKGDDIGIYLGTVPEAEPLAVFEVKEDESLPYVGDGQYLLTTDATGVAPVLAGITGGSHGATVTLLSTSATAPKVEAGEAIILKGGKTFVASEGSQLTLRAFDAGEGKMLWIEQSRFEAF